jgi:hypothetical protein
MGISTGITLQNVGLMLASTERQRSSHSSNASRNAPRLTVSSLASSSSWLARKIHAKAYDYSPSSTRCNARYRPLKVTGTSKPEEKYVQNGKEVKKQIFVLEEGFGSVLKIVTNLFPLWVSTRTRISDLNSYSRE